jgi:hypothetical protein
MELGKQRVIDLNRFVQREAAMISFRRLTVTLSVLTASMPMVLTAGQQQQVRVKVDDARPLAAAIRAVEGQLGVVITYEDAPYLVSEDTVDETAKVSQIPNPRNRSIVPRVSHFEFSYPVASTESGAVVAEMAVRAMLDAFGRSRPMASQFTVEESMGALHVVPVQVRGPNKSLAAYESLLNTRVAIPPQDRASDALQTIVSAVSKKSGRRLLLGAVPVGPLARTRVSWGPLEGSANDLISDLLSQTAPRLSWQIFCSPGDVSECYFSIHQVRVPVPDKTSRR